MEKYKVIRFYMNHRGNRTIKRDLTLEQAQKHCNDPETSSSTCSSGVGKARTRKLGPWFDGYDKM